MHSWYILGEILNALPYPLAIRAITDIDTKDILRHAATPEIMDNLCDRLMNGASVCCHLFLYLKAL